MKRILLITLLIIFLPLGKFFFLIKKNPKILPPQAEIGNSTDQRVLDSFKGIIDLEYEKPVLRLNEESASSTTPTQSKPDEKKNNSDSADTDNENVLTFAILGDTQRFNAKNPNGNFQKVMTQIAKLNPSLIVAEGDLVNNCDGDSKCSKTYADWKKIVGSFMSKTYAIQGNHDRTGGDKTDSVWRSSFDFPTNGPPGFSEQVYSLDFGNSHFVFLNSDKPKEHLVNNEQRSWLEKDLAANKKENTFVFFHEPAYPVSDKITESLDANPSERNALWQILEKYNVTAVFNGHEHIVSRRKIGSLYQFVFGSTDSFNHNLPLPGVAEYTNQGQGRFGIVKVNEKKITVETYDPSGKILNTFTFSK